MENISVEITAKVRSLLDQAYSIRVNDLNQSTSLAKEALLLSRESNQEALIAKCLNQLSRFQMIKGQYDESIELANEAIEYFEMIKDDKGIADAKYNIADALYKTDNPNLGLVHLLECKKTYKKLENYHHLARVQKSIGAIYEYFGDNKSAIKTYEEAIESGKKAGNLNLQSNAYNPLSGIYLNMEKMDRAMQMIEKAIEMKNEAGDIRGLAFSLYGRGKVYTKTGEFKMAEIDFLESIRIHEEMGERIGIGMCYHKLGALFLASQDYEQAKSYLLKALEFSEKHKVSTIRFKALYLLYTVFKKEDNVVQSLEYLEKYVEAKRLGINAHTSELIEGYAAIEEMRSIEQKDKAQKNKMEIIQEKNLELDSFFHRVSHDLKGSISSLISLDAILRDQIKDENILKFMDMSIDQVYRMNHILDELIKLTRTTHGNLEVHDINFEKLIEECLTSNTTLENFDKVKFESSVQQGLGFRAPWVLINTILLNLIENGIKYARIDQPNPFLNIDISEENGLLQIIAIDNGIGMKKETGKNIFEMFYRANKEVIGSGLGLYILVRAVERLEGTVDLVSEIETGSTFTVTLPMK